MQACQETHPSPIYPIDPLISSEKQPIMAIGGG
jgi:hypothetical protein